MKRLESTNQISVKVAKDVKPTYKESYYKTLGTSVINSPMSPPYLTRRAWSPQYFFLECYGDLYSCDKKLKCITKMINYQY